MAIGKPILNFHASSRKDPTRLILEDLSMWNNIQTLPATVSILVPGASIPETFGWAKNKRNHFNSINLNLTCLQECTEQQYEPLPDGIYHIELKGTPDNIYSFKRAYLKTDNMFAQKAEIYMKAWQNADFKTQKVLDDLQNIEFQLQSAEAFTFKGDYGKAKRAFEEAQNLINKYSQCKDCL